jgi:hypothetical protein
LERIREFTFAEWVQENADLVFGGVTIICGIFGTVAGGLILDKIGSTIQNGFKVFFFYASPK